MMVETNLPVLFLRHVVLFPYNELRIEDQELYLDVEIEDKSYFENITITGARIDTPLTYGTDTPYHTIEGDNTPKLTAEVSLPAAKNDLLLITL